MLQKKLFSFVIVVSIALLMAGCNTTPRGSVVIDSELPSENTALVMITSGIRVTEYNGIDVSESWYPRNQGRINRVTMPAGNTTLLFNINALFGGGNVNIRVRMEDIMINYNFEAGKEYTISLYAPRAESSTFFNPRQTLILAIWGRAFHDANPGSSYQNQILRSWELGEF